jgi:hypothetical protein
MDPFSTIEFEILGYLELLKYPDISEELRTKLAKKLADARALLSFATEKEERKAAGYATSLRKRR